MITKSLNKAAYITYITCYVSNIVEDREGMYAFKFEDTKEVKRAVEEYNRCISLQEKLCVDIVRYNKIIFNYKSLVKYYKKKKEREERLDKIDQLCDKVLDNLGKL